MVSKLLFPICILLLITSCYKDSEEFTEYGPDNPNPSDLAEIEGKLLGFVYDENGDPVADADVFIYSGSTITDDYGVFVFENQKLDPNGTYVKVVKEDYILGSDLVYPKKGPVVSYILMLADDGAYNFDATLGGTIELTEGGRIIFPASSIINLSGQVYDGNVKVSAKYLDPEDPNLADKMPGGLFGLDKEGIHRVLGTLGMMAVEISDGNGNKLKIKSGSKATLEFPVPSIDNIPSEIPLWSFDENAGLWIEEGQANLSGQNFIAEVSHFSFWNCDAPFPLVHACGSVVFQDGSPATNYLIKILTDGMGTGYGNVDLDGNFCGKIPKGKSLQLKVINPVCNKAVYESTIGPFDQDVEIDPITIDKNTFTVFGTVFCLDDLLSDATVILTVNERTIIGETGQNGGFEINLDNEICDNVTSFDIFAVSNDTGEASASITLTVDEAKEIVLNVCSNCDFDVNIEATVEDPCNQKEKKLTAEVSNGGNYSYSWSNGNTDKTTLVGISDLYCVTVTNTDEGCDKIVCEEINVKFNLADSSFVFYTDCDKGNIEIGVFGGVEPYAFNTTGPNGFMSTSGILENLDVGTYITTITDNEGCEHVTENKILPQNDFEIEIYSFNSCNETFIEVGTSSQGTRPESYLWSTGETTAFLSVIEDGQYCVTVTDNKGCVSDTCIDVIVEIVDITLTIESCDQNIYTFSDNDPNLSFNIYTDSGNSFEVSGDSSFTFDVLMYGYAFSYFGFSPNTECQFEDFFQLPKFKGLSIGTITHTSCDTCNDGNIEIIVDAGADCIDCVIGEIKLYSVGDLTTNLIDVNTNMMLPKGEYYVVVEDQNTGCFIASDDVKIE